MRRVALVVLFGLLLAGCGGSSGSTPKAAVPAPTPSVIGSPTGVGVIALPLACHGARIAQTQIRFHELGAAARTINSTRRQFQELGDPVADRLGRELTGGVVAGKVGVLAEAVAVCRASHAFG